MVWVGSDGVKQCFISFEIEIAGSRVFWVEPLLFIRFVRASSRHSENKIMAIRWCYRRFGINGRCWLSWTIVVTLSNYVTTFGNPEATQFLYTNSQNESTINPLDGKIIQCLEK